MKLVSPSMKFEAAFSEFYNDFSKHDAGNSDYYREGVLDFSGYVQRLLDEAQGVNLKQGYVPCSHFWLVHQGTIVGAIRIRHRIDTPFLSLEAGHIGYDIAPRFRGRGLGKRMLAEALPNARQLGLAQVMITADEDNMASRGVIEANGGILQDVVMGKVFPNLLARYWLSCSKLSPPRSE
ncbi:GNAT family N-acetyltransferase [Vibrio nomapromontoriensis]|uniref:GNAT family N-acetyltransferase n=1 Tax=Vibrio nomapromontoriensis TaxID=2910246 RepID=UPI003D119ACA